ncbi:Proteasome subunit alpha type-4-A [Smittium culicis]|uniref:Proteasome subunit alpha type n=1 Tax=Smittium culicis TaxID=133412 RepID=A0A1R1XZ96_9FUNG|nr:Proteasome subunit alpha type-4-A [Smittium culicis]OMJ20846.1 Proteasome subunit alpha type-4-A [Smittium culicis]
MARRYDSRTTIFSPDGRLYQVEYAMEAINHAGTVIGVLSSDGIIICAEKQQTSKLLDKSPEGEKIYEINSNIVSGVAGITSDANLLINEGRLIAQNYLLKYDADIPVEQLVRRLCDIKQGYTQFGGLRPFGSSFLIAGWDPIIGFQLYQTDPAGNYSGWKAACIGENNSSAQSLLKQEYKVEDDSLLSMDAAYELICKVISKTIDSSKLTSDNLEFSTLTLVDGTPKVSMFSTKDVDALLKKHSVENTA